MIITKEESLCNFGFWSGAEHTADVLNSLNCLVSYDVWRYLEYTLEDMYIDGVDETTLNDFFWFEEDAIAEWLGFEDWEALERFVDNDGEEEEEEEEEED